MPRGWRMDGTVAHTGLYMNSAGSDELVEINLRCASHVTQVGQGITYYTRTEETRR